ncbi:MAG: M42 family metallopeptidase [Candidatus Cloacimonetes bacterium]|nr:M42 family metallopeptidase [Candidatus Cloacimonadota bacterium]
MDSLKLLKDLTLAAGISGHESSVTKIMQDTLTGMDYTTDRMGNITFIKQGSAEGKKILFIAHQDEIGFIVSDILPQGFLQIQSIGGWDANTLLSSPVDIINKNGERIPGIIGSVPVHFQTGTNTGPNIDAMFIDIGASSSEKVLSAFGIELGAPVIPVCRFHHVPSSDRLFSKAFDDRAGVAALVETGLLIKDIKLKNTIYLCGSVQEEVGTRGATAVAGYTDADVCIVLEGAPADDIPGIPGNAQTCVGKGVHLRLFDPTMIVPHKLSSQIRKIAHTHDIPVQVTVRKRGGTDGRQIHTANHGIPTIVLGVPVRFAHSHNCHISLADYRNLVKLCMAIAENL